MSIEIFQFCFFYRNFNLYVYLKTACPTGTFLCSNNGNCISAIEVCDGVHDCLDGEDEKDCTGIFLYHCSFKKQTIPYQKVCDYNYDCLDQTDEKFCSSSSISSVFTFNQ